MLRLAIISSPRSGNTWLRYLLMGLYELEPALAFGPEEVDWQSLPDRCLLQLHWPRTRRFERQLQEHQFQVIPLARHPLDLLLSVLHFATHEPLTDRWLDGQGGSEASIRGTRPCSPAFVDYATGPRAAALLAVTGQWWQPAAPRSVRYEDLVADTAGTLSALDRGLGLTSEQRQSIAAVVEANQLKQLRPTSGNHHFWQGRPGLWRHLLPGSVARLIAARQPGSFEPLGYGCDPDPGLDRAQAEGRWDQLACHRAAG